MLSPELVRKVKRIEIITRKIVDDVMSGGYKSHFKGHGVQFSEHRVYTPGDDIRHIDWKVSARTKEPLIKKYEEERELTVLLVVDISDSASFGSSGKLKSEVVAELAAMLSYAAIHTGDKVGALLFSGEVEKIIPPKKGRQHIFRIIQTLLSAKPRTKGTRLAEALEAAGRVMKHAGVIFVLSDFIAQDYEIQLKRLGRKHDVVALWIRDERELSFPKVGQLRLMDPETGIERIVDTDSYAFQKWVEQSTRARIANTEAALKAGKVEQLRILTKEDYAEAVVRFFNARARGKSRG